MRTKFLPIGWNIATSHALIVTAFGAPFVLEGLFGEADAEVMAIESDSELVHARLFTQFPM